MVAEIPCRWTCPKCEHNQNDSVHPDDGPWFSCICESCGASSSDEDLDSQSQASWELARKLADAEP